MTEELSSNNKYIFNHRRVGNVDQRLRDIYRDWMERSHEVRSRMRQPRRFAIKGLPGTGKTYLLSHLSELWGFPLWQMSKIDRERFKAWLSDVEAAPFVVLLDDAPTEADVEDDREDLRWISDLVERYVINGDALFILGYRHVMGNGLTKHAYSFELTPFTLEGTEKQLRATKPQLSQTTVCEIHAFGEGLPLFNRLAIENGGVNRSTCRALVQSWLTSSRVHVGRAKLLEYAKLLHAVSPWNPLLANDVLKTHTDSLSIGKLEEIFLQAQALYVTSSGLQWTEPLRRSIRLLWRDEGSNN